MECLVSIWVLTAVLGLGGVFFSLTLFRQVNGLKHASNVTLTITDFVRQFRRDIREANAFTLENPHRLVMDGANRTVAYKVGKATSGVVTVSRSGCGVIAVEWQIPGTVLFALQTGARKMPVAKIRYLDPSLKRAVELKVEEIPR